MRNLTKPNFKEIAKEGAFVYCYLRSNTLTPYYVGIAIDPNRPISKSHSCAVPRDRARIRILRSGLTLEEAQDWEVFYIAHYGRKDLGTGILRNMTEGGEGRTGGSDMAAAAKKFGYEYDEWKNLSCARRAAIAARYRYGFRGKFLRVKTGDLLASKMAEKYGLTIEKWNSLSRDQKNRFTKRFKAGRQGDELFRESISCTERGKRSGTTRANQAISKYGISMEEYKNWDPKKKTLIAARYASGKRGEALLDDQDGNYFRLEKSAQDIGIDPIVWQKLSRKERQRLKARFRAGKFGDELFALKDSSHQPEQVAAKYGKTLSQWNALTTSERRREWERYRTKIVKSEEFGISLDEYAAMSVQERKSFMTMKRSAQKMGIDFGFWRSLDRKVRQRIHARYKRGMRGDSLIHNC